MLVREDNRLAKRKRVNKGTSGRVDKVDKMFVIKENR